MKRTPNEILDDIVKPAAIADMKRHCDRLFDALAVEYPSNETSTWPVQREEALAYIANNSESVPLINAALNENETALEYSQTVIANNTGWSAYAGSIINIRRSFEAGLNACETESDVIKLKEGFGI